MISPATATASLLLAGLSLPAPVQESVPDAAAVEAAQQLAQYPEAPFEDREGNLWFATAFEGLIRFDGEEFVTFSTAQGLASSTVRDVLEDEEGVLWVGTTGGVCRFDGTSFVTLTDYGGIGTPTRSQEQGFHRDVWDLHIDGEGTLWIATMDGVYRRRGETFESFPLPVVARKGSFEFTERMVYCIAADREGALWFGTDGAGAVRYDGRDTEVFTAREHGLCSDRVAAIVEDRRGDLWFGTSGGGVSRRVGGTFTTHLRNETYSEHTGWGRFLCIFEDRAGDVWFGAAQAGGGVHRFDGRTFRYYSQPEGLGTGGVPSIREDRSGRLWLGTTSGVFLLVEDRFVNFTRSGWPRGSRSSGD